MHVLIIEDEPLIAMSIDDTLRDCGCASFDFATSVEQAVAAAKIRCPDLITADVQLSPGCGIDAVAAICGGAPIPVIFITSAAGMLYRQCHRIENMFGKLKDWRRIHTRYDRYARTFMSAICIAATAIFWL